MDELLSLKWKNHCSAFLQMLETIRGDQMYADVTLACSGKFYSVHRMILTACSDYFRDIFMHLDSHKPVIVLKDINCENLEALLDYMYMGEVSVKQSDLSSLIKTAECLQVKGLAVADENTDPPKKILSKRLSSSPKPNRKRNIKEIQVSDKDNMPLQPKYIRREKITIREEEFPNVPDAKQAIEEDMVFIKDDAVFVKEELEDSFDSNLLSMDKAESKSCDVKDSDADFVVAGSSSQLQESYFNEGASMSPSQETSEWQSSESNWNFTQDYESVENTSTATSSLNDPRPWKCSGCKKSFHTAANLRRHFRIHTGEKPFACSLCHHEANVKSNLQKHMLIVHHGHPDIEYLNKSIKEK